MSQETTELQQVITLALKLSARDRIRLVNQIMTTLETHLATVEPTPQPKRSLYGLWAGADVDLSEETLARARQEMWGNFPREDIE